jgi:hypothetical protein
MDLRDSTGLITIQLSYLKAINFNRLLSLTLKKDSNLHKTFTSQAQLSACLCVIIIDYVSAFNPICERIRTMKKLFVFMLVLVLLAGMTAPALAAGGTNGNGGRGGNGNGGGSNGGSGSDVNGSGTGTSTGKGGKMPNVLIGTITSLDPLTRTVTVDVLSANTAAKDYVGQVITFLTGESTNIVLRNPDGVGTPITYEELAVGLNVSVAGVLSETGWTATRITVDPELLCLP